MWTYVDDADVGKLQTAAFAIPPNPVDPAELSLHFVWLPHVVGFHRSNSRRRGPPIAVARACDTGILLLYLPKKAASSKQKTEQSQFTPLSLVLLPSVYHFSLKAGYK